MSAGVVGVAAAVVRPTVVSTRAAACHCAAVMCPVDPCAVHWCTAGRAPPHLRGNLEPWRVRLAAPRRLSGRHELQRSACAGCGGASWRCCAEHDAAGQRRAGGRGAPPALAGGQGSVRHGLPCDFPDLIAAVSSAHSHYYECPSYFCNLILDSLPCGFH